MSSSLKTPQKFRILKFLLLVSFSLVFVAVVCFLTLEEKINQPLNVSKAELITINSGASISQLANILLQKKWLKNKFWFRNYPRIHTQLAKVKAGTYQITVGTTAKQLLEQLVLGKEHQFSLTFVEGTTFKQWLSLLKQQPYINNSLSGKSIAEISKLLHIEHTNPEGLFFPDTYAYTAGTTDLTILQHAHQQMVKQLASLWQDRARNLPFNSPYQALIMASIIEKETSKLDEQPLIASVFINRLAKKMRLQTDPTVIYGLGERYQGDITRQHLKEKTPYNTYRIKGLPPTPIAMPGKSALKASMHPKQSNYLYFVSKGNGYHVFSTSLKDHNKAVRRFLLQSSPPTKSSQSKGIK